MLVSHAIICPTLLRKLKNDMPYPKSLLGAWKEMLETWKIQKSDDMYALDIAVTQAVKINKKHNMPSDVGSIGDLAPKGLDKLL
jgi:hypothetical protein